MSKATKMAAAAAVTKKTATAKTTGKTEADYLLTVAAVRPVLKSYCLGTNNKFAVSYDTEGTTDFILLSSYVNSVLPEKGGYLTKLSEDGFTLRWSRPINLFLFSIEHLCSIMESKYSELNIRVRLFDKVTQALFKDKTETGANGTTGGNPRRSTSRRSARAHPNLC
jgi:hypothetical protein